MTLHNDNTAVSCSHRTALHDLHCWLSASKVHRQPAGGLASPLAALELPLLLSHGPVTSSLPLHPDCLAMEILVPITVVNQRLADGQHCPVSLSRAGSISLSS
uniref:Uncharacterized protein n=1 Tax=Micrurus corallinus TaxID=54390 RepID=A0A2D4FTA3_MICCO